MNNAMKKINNLDKVTLSLEMGNTPEVMDLTSQPFQFEFIFGLGTEGLTPFEYELAGKTEGDKIVIELEREKIHDLFQHLYKHLCPFPETPALFALKAEVVHVAPTETRDVIRALSEITGCGSDCSCGCGNH